MKITSGHKRASNFVKPTYLTFACWLKMLFASLLSVACLAISGCASPSGSYNPFDYGQTPGPNPNASNYSWANETNSYDPYGEDNAQAVTTDYNVPPPNAYNQQAMPSNPDYFYNNIGSVVHFATDSNEISASDRAMLQQQAQWLSQHHHRILIEGYTDDRGTRVYNIALGKHRASAVKDYLISLGIPSVSIKTVSYGVERPIAVCPNESCWAQNRRASIILR